MKIMRKIIEINEELCNGCGQCVISCAEGAIAIIDGKARLVSERYCDGLGACLGECPTGALQVVEREAEDFDEQAAHEHVKAMQEREKAQTMACGCPSTQIRQFGPASMSPCDLANRPVQQSASQSCLTHWPVQISLIPPSAPFLKSANLLVAADCVPVAYSAFHANLLRGKTVMLGCPKFDDAEDYVQRFAQIFKSAGIQSITMAIMEVPCCSAMGVILKKAMELAGVDIPVKKVVITARGDAQGL
ncbi:MAG: 4Fe-4S binding protein [Dissulfuribacterales bacterium]